MISRLARTTSALALAVLVAGLLVTLPAGPAEAGLNTWTSNGPWGGSIQDLTVDPSHPTHVWAGGASGGLYESTDRGKTWAFRGRGIGGRTVGSIGISPSDPRVLYAGINGDYYGAPGRFYRSTDGGATWSPSTTSFGANEVTDLVVHPTKPNIAYAALDSGGVYKTTDGGHTWSAVNNGIVSLYDFALLIRPNHPSVVILGGVGGFYKTTDGGANWNPIGPGFTKTVSSLAADPFDPSVLYAGTYDLGVWTSPDGGATWNPVAGASFPSQAADDVAVSPTTHVLYAASRGYGVYSVPTDNVAAPWSSVSVGITNPKDIWALAADPVNANVLYAGASGEGVYRITDAASSWKLGVVGLRNAFVQGLAVDPNDPATVFAGVTGGGGIFRSTNAGGSWTQVNTGLTDPYVRCLAVSPSNSSIVWAGVSSGGGESVYVSTDGGTSWNPTGLTSQVESIAVDPNDANTVYAGTAIDGVFKTVNGGASWDPMNVGLTASPDYPEVRSLALSPSNPNIIYFGSYGTVYKSVDGGVHWHEKGAGLSATSPVFSVTMHPTKPKIVYAAAGDAGMFVSTDGGTTWTPRNHGLAGKTLQAVVIDPANPRTLYAGTERAGVFRSLDAGGTWRPFRTGLTNPRVAILATGPLGRFIYAGTDGGGTFAYRYR